LTVLLLGVTPVAVIFETAARRRLRIYWDRRCTGIQWRRRFPSAPKQDIRAFLGAFVEAFGFSHERRLCFSPDDKVIDVYRTVYPSVLTPDALEMEAFAKHLEDRFGLDVASLPDPEYTLGELFALTHAQSI
jgi:hypothetical protein